MQNRSHIKKAGNIVLLFFLFGFLALSGQRAEDYYFKNLTTVDGLSQNSVNLIMQDDQGMIWMATQAGIDKYTGREVMQVNGFVKSLTEQITCLFDWNQDYILASSNKKTSLINKWKFRDVKTLQTAPTNIVYLSKTSADSYLVFTDKAVYYADLNLSRSSPNLFQITDNDNSIQQVVESKNRTWYLSTKKGLAQFDKKKQQSFVLLPGIDEDIRSLCFSKDSSSLFCGSVMGNLYAYKPGTGILKKWVIGDGNRSPSYEIKSLLMDQNGVLWVGTNYAGVYLYDIENGDIGEKVHFHAGTIRHVPSRFSSNDIACLYHSKEGVAWVGTGAGGVNYWQPDKPVFRQLLGIKTAYQHANILEGNYVWSIYVTENGKTLYAGLNGNGIARIDMETERVSGWLKPEVSEPFSSVVYAMRKKGDTLYLATKDGIYFTRHPDQSSAYQPLKSPSGTPILSGKRVSVLNFDATSRKWLAGYGRAGEIHVFDENFGNPSLKILPLPGQQLSFIQTLPQFTLVGTNKGLYQMDKTGQRVISSFIKDTSHFTCVLQQGDSLLWLGTDRKGLYRYDLRSRQGKYLDAKDGLPAEVIYDVFMDRDGNLWLSTNHGLYQYNVRIDAFNHYDVEDGLGILEYNLAAGFSQGDSVLFFGGINGLNYVLPKATVSSTSDYLPVLRYLQASEDSIVYIIDFNCFDDQPIELPFKFGYLSILPPVLGDFADASNNQFRLKFNGELITPQSNGAYIIAEGKVTNNISSLLWGKNTIKVYYRTGNGAWKPLPEIQVKRVFFSGVNWFILLIIPTLLALFVFFRSYKSNQRLKIVHEKINEVSRMESTESICQMALDHLVNDLKFRYATISLIDFEKREIRTQYIKDASKNQSEIEEWKSLSCYPLEHDDVLAQTVAVGKDGSYVMVSKNKIISNTKIRVSENLFNKKVANRFKHDQLTRIFIPIVNRALSTQRTKDDENTTADIVLGVIEVGLNTAIMNKLLIKLEIPASPLRSDNFDLSKYFINQQLRLKLYVDNLSQPYLKAYTKEQKKEMYQFVEQLERDCDVQGGNHETLLHIGLEAMSKRIGAAYGDISLTTYNSEKINFKDHDLFYGYDRLKAQQHASIVEDKNRGKAGIINYVAETGKYYYSDDVGQDDKYIEFLPDIKSELAIPMILNDATEAIGVFNFLSPKPAHFNQVLADIYIKGVKRLTELYLQKKQYLSLREIKTPVDAVSQTEGQFFKGIVTSLRNYFKSDYISIWRRKHSDKNDDKKWFYICDNSTISDFYKEYERFGFTEAVIKEEFSTLSADILEIWNIERLKNRNARIYSFCKQEHLAFKSYIVLKIVIDDEFQAFINVFSRRKIHAEEVQGYPGALLDEVGKKAALAIQNIRLAQSIEIISGSLTKGGEENPQKKIVEQAYRLSPSAHSVILFPYQKGRQIKIKDAIVGGKLPPEIAEDSERPVVFANYIIEHGTQWLDTEAAFLSVLKQAGNGVVSRASFWQRYKLKSVAVIRLEYNGEPVGVMFFNYTENKNFKEGSTRDFIDAFTNFATIALINEDFIHRIQDERENLNIEIENLILHQKRLRLEKEGLGKEKEQIKFEYEDVYKKMDEMIPRANQASFYLIMQGISHDINNFLIDMALILNGLIDENGEITHKGKNELKEIRTALRKNLKMIQNLLHVFEKKEESTLESIKIQKSIQEIILFFYNKSEEIKFHFQMEDPEFYFVGYKESFSMAIYNLLKNAVQAIESRGVEKKSGDIYIDVTLTRKNEFAINVSDNGIGMDRDQIENIFKYGYTTKDKGLGIGLYFVKHLIEESFNGTISVESTKGKGTTFKIIIPNNK